MKSGVKRVLPEETTNNTKPPGKRTKAPTAPNKDGIIILVNENDFLNDEYSESEDETLQESKEDTLVTGESIGDYVTGNTFKLNSNKFRKDHKLSKYQPLWYTKAYASKSCTWLNDYLGRDHYCKKSASKKWICSYCNKWEYHNSKWESRFLRCKKCKNVGCIDHFKLDKSLKYPIYCHSCNQFNCEMNNIICLKCFIPKTITVQLIKPLGYYTKKKQIYICGKSVLGGFGKQKVESLDEKEIYKSIVEKGKLSLKKEESYFLLKKYKETKLIWNNKTSTTIYQPFKVPDYTCKNYFKKSYTKIVQIGDNRQLNTESYYTPEALHSSQVCLIKEFIWYTRHKIIKEYTGNNRGINGIKNHLPSLDGWFRYGKYRKLKGLTSGFMESKRKTNKYHKDYSKIFLGNYSNIWNNNNGQFCIGIKNSTDFGINYKGWPGGEQLINQLFDTVGEYADYWHPITVNGNRVYHRKIWNCVQINMGNIIKNKISVFAPKFHLDDQVLYSCFVQGIPIISGIVAATLQGSNAICLNKRYWCDYLDTATVKDMDFTVENLIKKPQYWASKLLNWSFVKQPRSVYGLFGPSTYFWQHSVLTTAALFKIYKQYNLSITKLGYKDLCVQGNYFKDEPWTALFRCTKPGK